MLWKGEGGGKVGLIIHNINNITLEASSVVHHNVTHNVELWKGEGGGEVGPYMTKTDL